MSKKSVIKNKIGKYVISTYTGKFIYYKILTLLGYLISDTLFIKIRYFLFTGNILNLKNPQTFNEKLQWFKLNRRNSLVTRVADKYEVREYVKEKGLKYILIPLIGKYTSFDQIDFSTLPNKFILKANHGSGWNAICFDKATFDKKKARKNFNLWMNTNYFYSGRSWEYKNISPLIVCEEFISCKNIVGLEDYKIYCFNGEPTYIQYVSDIIHGKNKDSFYDTSWKMQDFSYTNILHTEPAEQPKNLSEMLDIAKKLSVGFEFARIDLYNCDGKIYFGEITLHPASGMDSFNPKKYNRILGDKINLKI